MSMKDQFSYLGIFKEINESKINRKYITGNSIFCFLFVLHSVFLMWMLTGWGQGLDPGCSWSGPHPIFLKPTGWRFDKTLSDVTVSNCKAACESETDFKCIAFTYWFGSYQCDLIRANRTDMDEEYADFRILFKIVCSTEGVLS